MKTNRHRSCSSTVPPSCSSWAPGNTRLPDNTAADLIAVLAEAISQVPKPYRRKLLVTCDGDGASHELIDWLIAQDHAADRNLEFSVGFDIDADVRAAITAIRPDCWTPALDNSDGGVRALTSRNPTL